MTLSPFKSDKRTKAAMLLFCIVLQSCLSTKTYRRPEMSIPDTYRTDIKSFTHSDVGRLTFEFWQNDERLKEYLNRALNSNFDLERAIKNIEMTENYLIQSRAAFFPSLTTTSNFTRTKNSPNSQFGRLFSEPVEQFQLSGAMSWELDIWGKIRSGKRASGATYLQSKAAYQAIKTGLMASVITSYFQLMSYDKQIEIASETLKSRKLSLETIKALKEAGQVTEAAVKQTEAQIYNTEVIIFDLKRNTLLLENSFCLLLGEPAHEIKRSKFTSVSASENNFPGLPSELLANRPDVLEAEFALVNAFELSNVARSNLYPSISIALTKGFQSLQSETWLSSGSLFSQLVSGISQPLFQAKRLKSQSKIAEVKQEQALLDYQKALFTAYREVNDALINIHSYEEITESRKKEFNAYSQAEEFSEALLNNGLANYLEVLNAQQNALNSQLRIVDSEMGIIRSKVELIRALGGNQFSDIANP